MKRIALVLALVAGSQGCLSHARTGGPVKDSDVAQALVLGGLVVGTIAVFAYANEHRTDYSLPTPLPPTIAQPPR